MLRIGALEAGGTKMVMAIFDADGNILDQKSIATGLPEDSIPVMKAYFAENKIDAIGVASFGPLDLHQTSEHYGSITSTPKPGWLNYPLLKELTEGLDIPAGFDTDVNAAAIAEARMGASQNCTCSVYVTIGTGIGGGIVIDGKALHGLVHPELGHMLLRPFEDDPIPNGICPYHKGCLEGLASGPALCARCNGDASKLADDDPLFTLEAHYIAQMCTNLMLCYSPERIVLGGGVMQRKGLLPLVHSETLKLLGNYVQNDLVLFHMDEYIVYPKLFPYSGLYGAYILGRDALIG